MNVTELAGRGDEVQIVDVRYPNEWEAGRMDGSVHIVEDELDHRLDELDRGRPVVTVCRSGSRSARAARYLVEQGFDAESLDGGMLAWSEAGLDVTTPDGATGTVVEPEAPAEDLSEEHQRLHAEFMSLVFEVQARFGDDATEEQIQGFLRDRMITEGRSPEEADEVIGRITSPDPPAEPGEHRV